MAPLGATIGLVTRVIDWRTLTPLLFFVCLQVLPPVYSWPLRTDRHSVNDDQHYQNGNIRCLYCPPGTYVQKDCETPDTLGTCTVCHAGRTYSEHPTGINHCLTCTKCRDDQEEVSPCTTTKNTVCRCKKGTFCPPDHPCEICLTCKSSCPPDQIIQTPCNSTSDIQCGPPDSAINRVAIVSSVLVVTGLGILGIIVFCCMRKKTSAKDYKQWAKRLNVSCKQVEASEEDTETSPLQTGTELVFDDRIEDQDVAINKLFDMIVEKVPTKEFERFMRHLGLDNNKIEFEKMNNQNNTKEQYFAMLVKWRQEQASFNVNILLRTLNTLNLRNAANEITGKLIKDELFMWRPQN